MDESYAAVWSYDGAPAHVGRADLTADALLLEDATPQRGDRRRLAIREIADVRLSGTGERVEDLKTLALQLTDGTGVRIGVLGLGAANELHARVVERVHAYPAPAPRAAA